MIGISVTLLIVVILFIVFRNKIKVKLLESEADKGSPEVQFALSIMLLQGIGVKKNTEKGLAYLKRSADAGNIQAQYLYAGTMININGINNPEVNSEVARYFEKAAEGGQIDAITTVASFYEKGIVFPQDKTRSFYWQTIAAQKGNLESQQKMAEILDKTKGADKVEAYAWYKVAANNGDETANDSASRLYDSFSDEDKAKASERALEYISSYVHNNNNKNDIN